MKIVDARSGEVVTPGQAVTYGDGEQLKLIEVDEGLVDARALIETTCRDADQVLVIRRQWVQLTVRLTHPSFLFQRVGFIES